MVVTRVLNLLLTASDNQAVYRCDATNEAKTTISAQAKLLVHYPPEFSPEQTTEVQVVEDEAATIPLMVSANPEVLLTLLLPQYFPLSLHSDAPSVKPEKDPVFVNLGGTADLICVADANPIIPGMFSWKWLPSSDDVWLPVLLCVVRQLAHHLTEGGSKVLSDSSYIKKTAFVVSEYLLPSVLLCVVTPKLRKGPQWRKVASRGDGTTTAELCLSFFLSVRHKSSSRRYEERTAREGYFHTSTLRVVNVSAILDYAFFSCTARNSLGDDKLDIQLVSTSIAYAPLSI
ncbi:hypothetical protein GOODEAATRI_009855 [Goodea atripinnis]|uniref:Ig-like domain-containing protein n=1 Tax=Goodea atripinnis TaxID=208336 RepID=A0ABV0P336_9TELE